MPRRARFCPAGYPIHVIQRGNNRQAIFTDLLTCLRYIELNPVRAGMVKDPADYHWSSYGCHAFGVRAGLWSPHYLYLDLAKTEEQRQQTWKALINESLDIEVLAKVRHCANTGLVLGTESFREQVHRLRS